MIHLSFFVFFSTWFYIFSNGVKKTVPFIKKKKMIMLSVQNAYFFASLQGG